MISLPVLVGITQRVVPVPSRNERRDTLDQAWIPFLAAAGLEPLAVPNLHPDPPGYLRRLGARGLILSGGGNISLGLGTRDGRPARFPEIDTDLAPERDETETALLRASVEEGWPVLGVCRGMQALNLFHGGSLIRLAGHAGTQHPLATRDAHGSAEPFVFDPEVNSFHDLGIAGDGVGSDLEVLADADGMPEAFLHRSLPHLGIMWHPERNQPFSRNDVELFRRFFHASRAEDDD